MLKSFFKEGLIYGFSGILTNGISLLLIPFYTRVFVPSDYGVIDVITILAVITNLIFRLEITQAIGRYFGDDQTTFEKRVKYASSALVFILFMYLVFIALGTFFRGHLAAYISDEKIVSEKLVLFAIFSIALNGPFYFFLNQLKWIRKVKAYALLSFFHSLATISLTIYFVLVAKVGLIGVFYAPCLTTPFFLVLGFFLTRECYQWYFSREELFKLLQFSLPLVPAAAGQILMIFSDKFFIKELLSLSELGLYGISFRFSSVITIVFLGFSHSLSPLIYQNYYKDGAKKEIVRIFKYFSFFSLLLVLFLSLYSKEILVFFTRPDYYEAYKVLPILLFSNLMAGIGMFLPGLHIAKKTKKLALIHITSGFANVFLNLLLIPILGSMGAGLATLGSLTLSQGILFYYSQKEYYLEYPLKKYLIPLGTIFILIIANYYYSGAYEISCIFISIKFFIFLLFGFLMVQCQVLTKTDLASILKKIKIRR